MRVRYRLLCLSYATIERALLGNKVPCGVRDGWLAVRTCAGAAAGAARGRAFATLVTSLFPTTPSLFHLIQLIFIKQLPFTTTNEFKMILYYFFVFILNEYRYNTTSVQQKITEFAFFT